MRKNLTVDRYDLLARHSFEDDNGNMVYDLHVAGDYKVTGKPVATITLRPGNSVADVSWAKNVTENLHLSALGPEEVG